MIKKNKPPIEVFDHNEVWKSARDLCDTPDGKPCSKYSPLTPSIIKPACWSWKMPYATAEWRILLSNEKDDVNFDGFG